MNAARIVNEMIALFDEYREAFGLCDHDFPSDKFQERQCDFEEKFNSLICKVRGHNIGPDQCNNPEHDYCYRCGKLKMELISEQQ